LCGQSEEEKFLFMGWCLLFTLSHLGLDESAVFWALLSKQRWDTPVRREPYSYKYHFLNGQVGRLALVLFLAVKVKAGNSLPRDLLLYGRSWPSSGTSS